MGNADLKTAVVALVGNPNCGKTTVFNGLTGSDQRVGNWPGVTVERLEGRFAVGHERVTLVDLPGLYALSAFSEDERISRDYIRSHDADLLVNVIDATNLERNLYLTCGLIELQVPLVVVLTMIDLAEKKGVTIDESHLSRHLGVSVYGVNATDSSAVSRLRGVLAHAVRSATASPAVVRYPNEVEEVVEKWSGRLARHTRDFGANPRWLALKFLEQDPRAAELSKEVLEAGELDGAVGLIERLLNRHADEALADARYGFIHGIARDVVRRLPEKRSVTEAIDAVVMHRFWGIPIFLSAMYLVFGFTISIGGAFIDFFDILTGIVFVDGIGGLLDFAGAPVWLTSILSGGIGTGIQTVSTFIPVIFAMFFALAALEDSGYMARAAFIMDRFMRALGLPGKSFLPMLVGFGCTVPAILGTRTLENKKDRFLTIFMTPFMSCGARLPVYAFFAAVFFPNSGGLVVFALYLTGIVLAVLTGLLLKHTLFSGEVSHFIMELPPYHGPRLRHILFHTWLRLKMFIVRAGKVIVLSVMILAGLNTLGTDGSLGNENTDRSLLAAMGRALTPAFGPIGIEAHNWPASVALFSGIFAKEAVIGTLTALYAQDHAAPRNADDGDVEPEPVTSLVTRAIASIGENLAALFPGGEAGADSVEPTMAEVMRSYFPGGAAQAFAFLLFVLLYFPCVASFGAAMKEMGIFLGSVLVIYMTSLAWITATLFYQFAQGQRIEWMVPALGMLAALVWAFRCWGSRKEAARGSSQGRGL